MPPLTDLQKNTLAVIRQHRREKPITGKKIAEAIGLKPRQSGKEGADMRSIIHALRCKGYPICATGSGYWWPRDASELAEYIESFQRRIEDQHKALAAMKFEGIDKLIVDSPEAMAQIKYQYGAEKDGKYTIFTVPHARLSEFLQKFPNAREIKDADPRRRKRK